ncbi:hypothetical protein RRG08_035757 [Elysia crispata]|uniref:Uncharacterized protein n=1 Tax=Elysia crispata TaxID=231223 RepID=A0AAE0ZMU7_9GAST|nr:hypothetical protein RRG08_035757 [Elysia crispata]
MRRQMATCRAPCCKVHKGKLPSGECAPAAASGGDGCGGCGVGRGQADLDAPRHRASPPRTDRESPKMVTSQAEPHGH